VQLSMSWWQSVCIKNIHTVENTHTVIPANAGILLT
jgi:hypothetical protein